MESMESRVTELEIKLGFAESLLDEVNMTVFRQQQQIDLLQHEIRTLRQQMQAAIPAETRSLRDELPPHY
jgi:SlyX protein